MKEWINSCYLLVLFMLSCSYPQQSPLNVEQERQHIRNMLNDWHDAASKADFRRYFAHMADSSIFMGTDATEYWDKEAFMEFSRPYFDRGRAWDFAPLNRHIYFSDDKKTAWFDEELDTPNLGLARGSGVLVYRDSIWLITHYNLSIPIPNAIVEDVVRQIEAHQQP